MIVCSTCVFLETVMMSCVARSKPMQVPVNLTMLLSTPGEKVHPVVSEIIFGYFRCCAISFYCEQMVNVCKMCLTSIYFVCYIPSHDLLREQPLRVVWHGL